MYLAGVYERYNNIKIKLIIQINLILHTKAHGYMAQMKALSDDICLPEGKTEEHATIVKMD